MVTRPVEWLRRLMVCSIQGHDRPTSVFATGYWIGPCRRCGKAW